MHEKNFIKIDFFLGMENALFIQELSRMRSDATLL